MKKLALYTSVLVIIFGAVLYSPVDLKLSDKEAIIMFTKIKTEILANNSANTAESIVDKFLALNSIKFDNVKKFYTREMLIEAIKHNIEYGIPASFKLAQCAVETGYGLKKGCNNYFGIKGPGCEFQTFEYFNKYYLDYYKKAGIKFKSVTKLKPDLYYCVILDNFRAYDDFRGSFKDHSILLKNSYKKLFESKDYKHWTYHISKLGYATAINYTEVLNSIIESNKLYLLDI